jgi:hypothetical protein
MSFLNDLANFGKGFNDLFTNPIGTIANVAKPVVQQVANDANKAYNTVQAPVTGIVGSALAQGDRLFNGGKNYNDLLAATRQQMDNQLRNSFVAPNVASGKASITDFAKNFGSTGVHLAPYAVGGGGALTDALGAKVAENVAANTGKQVLGNLAGKGAQYAATGAISAPVFAGLDAAQQAIDTGKFDPGQSLRVGALSGALTGLGGLGGDLASGAIRNTARGWEGASNAMVREAPNIPQSQMSQAGFAKVPAKNQMPLIPEQPVPAAKAAQPAAPIQAFSKNAVPNTFSKKAVEGKQNIAPETAALAQGEHVVRNTQALIDRGAAEAGKFKNNSDLINAAHERMAVKPGALTDEDISFIAQAIERADKEGKFDVASQLHDSLSEHAVAAGQRVQALSIFYNRTPQGLFNKAIRDIKKANGKDFEITPELRKELQAKSDAIGAATSKDAKDYAIADLQKAVEKHLPQGTMQNILSVWKAGLLSGPITHLGNALSNGTFAGLRKVSELPATGADIALAAFGKTNLGKKAGFTGERSRALTLQGIGSGAKEGAQSAFQTVKTGIDKRNIVNGKYEGHGELNFKNPVIQNVFGKPSNLVFRALSSGDQPFFYSAAKNSLFDQAKTAGINKGLKGTELDKFVKNTVDNPSKSMANLAEKEAWKAVLGEDRKIATSISSFVGKHPALQTIVPFTKVPTNFLAQTLEYTPVGAVGQFIKAVNSAKKGVGVNQRELTEAIGKSATGTGVLLLGATLAGNGLVSGAYPTDPKEVERWRAQGIQPNSVKIGNNWISLNYAGPIGLLLQAGKDYNDAAARGDNQTMAAISGLGKSLTGQSFLTGFSGFANALNDPGRYGEKLINQQIGSIAPNWLAQTANFTDPMQRQVDTAGQSIQTRIPGFRNALAPKQDVYGNQLAQRTGDGNFNAVDQTNLVLNPFRPSTMRTGNVLDEVARLHNVDPNNKDLQVTPTRVDPTVSVSGTKVALTDKQQYDLQQKIGQETQQRWGNFIQTPEYQQLNDADKAKALDNLRKDSTAVATRQFVADNQLGQYKDQLSNSQKNLAAGASDITQYAKAGASNPDNNGGASTIAISTKLNGDSKAILSKYNSMSTEQRKQLFDSSNDAEYKYEQAKYDNDVANGSLSKAEAARAKSGLAKAKVGSSYTKETRDLYGLSKQDLYNVLTSDPNGKDMAEKIIAYGDALQNAGLGKNKFRDSKGNVSIAPSTGGSRGGRKGSTSAAGAISAAAAGSRAAANAKLAVRGGGFQNKVGKGRGIQAYKKPTKTVVRTA